MPDVERRRRCTRSWSASPVPGSGDVVTMQRNQNKGMAALPNVLRDQTVPNRLRGMGLATAPAVVQRGSGISLGLVTTLLGVAVAIAMALFLAGRGS
jgi:hypothetical protein